MQNSFHGHDVMRMMLESGETYTKESLEEEIYRTFGKNASFHTCSAQDMNARELIEFLEKKGKFVFHGDKFQTRQENICQH